MRTFAPAAPHPFAGACRLADPLCSCSGSEREHCGSVALERVAPLFSGPLRPPCRSREDMRSAFRFSNACSLAKRCSLVSCWLFMSRSCMYIRVEWAEHHIISYHAPHEQTGPSNKTSHPSAHALTSISFRRRMGGKTGAGEFRLRHSASHLILITTRSLCKDGLCSKLINTH